MECECGFIYKLESKHNKTKKHFEMLNIKNKIITQLGNNIETTNHYNYYKCKLCNIFIHRYKKNYHIKSNKHKKN